MAYFGVIFFANMGGGGGQNYFQKHPLAKAPFRQARVLKTLACRGLLVGPSKYIPVMGKLFRYMFAVGGLIMACDPACPLEPPDPPNN